MATVAWTDSKAYQQTSRMTHASQTEARSIGKMAVKPMTSEQFFATLSQAIGRAPESNRLGAGRDEDGVRRGVLNQFGSSGLYSEPETSVSQALTIPRNKTCQMSADPSGSWIPMPTPFETSWPEETSRRQSRSMQEVSLQLLSAVRRNRLCRQRVVT